MEFMLIDPNLLNHLLGLSDTTLNGLEITGTRLELCPPKSGLEEIKLKRKKCKAQLKQ